ncbi:MAG: MBL fold metallo-hydrolase, partial [Myxococcota bacterium]
MIFRQLFDLETSSYSYLLADPATREAVLIDPVIEKLERDLALLRELELRLVYTLETHVHADHVTAAARLREALGSKIALGAEAGARNA